MTDVIGASIAVSGETNLVPSTRAAELVTITNQDAAISVFIGGPGVRAFGGTRGYELKAGKPPWTGQVPGSAVIQAYPASGTPVVDVLRIVAD